MTARGSQTLTWDVENRLISVSGGASFVYDGNGNRVMKTEGGETILYVNQYYEKNLTTGVVTTYYYLGGKLVAMREGTDLKYTHDDHLSRHLRDDGRYRRQPGGDKIPALRGNALRLRAHR
jgi:hypothetical protein